MRTSLLVLATILPAAAVAVRAPATVADGAPPTGSPAAADTAAVLFHESFDGRGLASPRGGVAWGEGRNVRVTRENARSGCCSLRAVYPATAPRNPPNAQQSIVLPGLREVWAEWYVFIPPTWAMADVDRSDNKKWFLLKDADVKGGANAVAVYLEYDTTPEQQPGARLLVKYEVDEGQPEYTWKSTPVADFLTARHRGKWVQFRMHVKLATTRTGAKRNATGNGVVRVWRDGELIHANRSAPLKAVSRELAGRNTLGYGYLLGAANNGFPRETVYDLDDFRLYASDPGWR